MELHTMIAELIPPLAGGALIGVAALALMHFLGRIAGICGISYATLVPGQSGRSWRLAFIAGLMLGSVLSHIVFNMPTPAAPTSNLWLLVIGGLCIGCGTTLGNGCTSGHGICGISRGSIRSIAATMTFMLTGIITMYLGRHVFGGL